VGSSTNIKWHAGTVSRDDKVRPRNRRRPPADGVPRRRRPPAEGAPSVPRPQERLLGQRGCVVWFTGLSGSGKSTVAGVVERVLHERGRATCLLDGDNVRHGLCADLGFGAADREENIRRVGEVARLMADSGLVALVAFISPYERDRARARGLLDPGRFVEVFCDAPLAVCEARDPKGLYRRARAGELRGMTGIDDPYEAPRSAEVVLGAGAGDAPEEQAAAVVAHLDRAGLLAPPPAG